jgi:dTDP-L-rhamnose 4-epimerase
LEASEWNPKCTKCKGNVNPIPTAEDSMPRPSSIYAATKLAQENLVKIACEAIGINSVILRFQNVYGPGQSLNNPYTGILSIFSTRIRRGLNLSLFEDGLESRDFIYISDITKAIRLSIDEDAANNKILNVGTGRPTTIMEISKLLVETLGGEQQPVVTGQYRIGDIRHCYADTTLMSNILKFKTTMSIQTGIKKFCDWVINQPLPKDKLDIANTELKNRGLLG